LQVAQAVRVNLALGARARQHKEQQTQRQRPHRHCAQHVLLAKARCVAAPDLHGHAKQLQRRAARPRQQAMQPTQRDHVFELAGREVRADERAAKEESRACGRER
jgi:hypothetical protein